MSSLFDYICFASAMLIFTKEMLPKFSSFSFRLLVVTFSSTTGYLHFMDSRVLQPAARGSRGRKQAARSNMERGAMCFARREAAEACCCPAVSLGREGGGGKDREVVAAC